MKRKTVEIPQAEVPIDTAASTTIINRLLDEMRMLSREEWFEIGRKAGHGGFGFSPMRQLQLRIRSGGIKFGPQLWAIFATGGGILRWIPWPKPPGWKQTRKWEQSGWSKKAGLDPEPWRKIDPALARIDELETLHGSAHPLTVRAIRELVELCCADIKS